MTTAARTGVVAEFDEHAGYGTVECDGDGEGGTDGERYFFHCTAIADGSRTIPPAAAVTFTVVPGHNGRWEAAAVRPV